jgi:esterase/lipase
MSNYFSAIAQLQESTWTEETTLAIADANRSQFFFQSRPTEKLILFFHGFTAIPEQFAVISTALFDAGYNVIVPRLPGHGITGDWTSKQPPPLPETPVIYQEFALEWLDAVQPIAQQVIVGGLSGGATLAAWLAAQRHVDRTLLFAPYLNNNNGFINWVVETFEFYFKWRTAPNTVNFGYEGFRMPALRAFLNLGQTVLEHGSVGAPSLIVSSDADPTTPESDFEQLYQATSAAHTPTWNIRFESALSIPHNMMTSAEGNPHIDLVMEITKLYLKGELDWDAVQPLVEKRIRDLNTIAH